MYSKLNESISRKSKFSERQVGKTAEERNHNDTIHGNGVLSGTERLSGTKLNKGDVVSRHELMTIRGNSLQIPDPENLVHLQFRRYAGCPVCNLHMHTIARRHDEILAAGIREVVVFHSKVETMLEFQNLLPFAAIADPEKELYAKFGADRKMSTSAALNPRTWWAAINALARAPSLHGAGGVGEETSGLPAEFLIGSNGKILASKYGKRVDDHWSVDELLDLARQR
jgi:peroxiredoxin